MKNGVITQNVGVIDPFLKGHGDSRLWQTTRLGLFWPSTQSVKCRFPVSLDLSEVDPSDRVPHEFDPAALYAAHHVPGHLARACVFLTRQAARGSPAQRLLFMVVVGTHFTFLLIVV